MRNERLLQHARQGDLEAQHAWVRQALRTGAPPLDEDWVWYALMTLQARAVAHNNVEAAVRYAYSLLSCPNPLALQWAYGAAIAAEDFALAVKILLTRGVAEKTIVAMISHALGRRRLQARFSFEAAEDLRAFNQMDTERDLTATLTAEMSREIDREILSDLGASHLEAGFVWAPYVPLQLTRLIHTNPAAQILLSLAKHHPAIKHKYNRDVVLLEREGVFEKVPGGWRLGRVPIPPWPVCVTCGEPRRCSCPRVIRGLQTRYGERRVRPDYYGRVVVNPVRD